MIAATQSSLRSFVPLLLSFVITCIATTPATIGWTDLNWGFEYMDIQLEAENPDASTANMNGTYYFHVVGIQVDHWFKGSGLISEWQFHNNTVYAGAKFIESQFYCKLKPDWVRTPCNPSALDRPMNAHVAFTPMPDGAITSQMDTTCWDLLDTTTLTAYGMEFQKDQVGCNCPFCFGPSHLHNDIKTGSVFGFVNAVKIVPSLNQTDPKGYYIYEVPPSQPNSRIIRATVVLPQVMEGINSYIHSFSITENYVIIPQNPWDDGFLSPTPYPNYPFRDFKFEKGRSSVFSVVSRRTWEVKATVEITAPDNFCMFHTINAYEEGDHIIVDMINWPNGTCAPGLNLAVPGVVRTNSRQYTKWQWLNGFTRWTIPTMDAVIRTGPTMTDGGTMSGCEMPTMNYWHFNGYKYRYFYAACQFLKTSYWWDTLKKFDLQTREVKSYHESLTTFFMEPMFAPVQNYNKTRNSEDDGYLLSLGTNSLTNTTFLLVLNASTFTKINKFSLPHGVHLPFGFHGRYFTAGSFH